MNGYPCTVIGSTFDEAFTVLWKLPGQMKAHVLIRESLVSQHLFLPNRDTLRKSSSHITAPSPSFAWDKPILRQHSIRFFAQNERAHGCLSNIPLESTSNGKTEHVPHSDALRRKHLHCRYRLDYIAASLSLS